MTFGAQVAIIVFFPTVLVSQGFTIVNSLFFTMIINVGGLVGALLASYFAANLPRKAVLGFGALAAVAVALLYAVVRSTELILLFGALMQLMFTPEHYHLALRARALPDAHPGVRTGTSVVALIGASVMPYLAGLIFGASGVVGLFVMVAVMYLIMSAAVFWLNVETKDKSLEELSEV